MPEGAFEKHCPLKLKFTRDGKIISATSGGLSAEHLGQKINHLPPFTKSDLEVFERRSNTRWWAVGTFLPRLWILSRPAPSALEGSYFTYHRVDQQVYYCRLVNLIFTHLAPLGREGKGKNSCVGCALLPGPVREGLCLFPQSYQPLWQGHRVGKCRNFDKSRVKI